MGLGPSHPTGQPTLAGPPRPCLSPTPGTLTPCRPLLVGEPWRRRPPRTLPRAPLPVPCIACEHASLLYPRPSRSPLPCTRSIATSDARPTVRLCLLLPLRCCCYRTASRTRPLAPYVGERGRRATAGGVEGEGDGGRRRGRGRQAFGAAENEQRNGGDGSDGCIYSPPTFSRGWGGDPRLKGNL